jgi:hypothetical protein
MGEVCHETHLHPFNPSLNNSRQILAWKLERRIHNTNRKITVIPVTLVLLTMFCLSITTAQIDENKLLASDGAANDEFGGSVSLSGDYALIGASDDDDNGTNAGSAYIFYYDGSNWEEQTELIG